MEPIKLAVSILPVFAFVLALIYLDSYKLVRFRTILLAIGVGGAAALGCYLISRQVLPLMPPEITATLGGPLQVAWPRDIFFKRYLAPVIEESLKGIFLIVLIRLGRIGFMVDAAIIGASLGAGFSFVENLYYLQAFRDPNLLIWIIRGFGTAIMHSGCTALLGIIAKSLEDRGETFRWRLMLPGLGLAIAIHSLFNHFLLPPVISTLIQLVTLPALVMVVYDQSEKKLRTWLGGGFDAGLEVLEIIASGTFSQSRTGRYLLSLKKSFPGEVVADMLCYLRLHLELGLRAKGLLMMREQGFDLPPDPEVRARLEELRYLEQSIGPTGRLAVEPFLPRSRRDLWQLYMLKKT